MTTTKVKQQYLLVDTKFLNLFQHMFEHMSDFISDWDHSIPDVLSHSGLCIEQKGDLMILDSEVEKMKEILKLFNDLAHEDMIEKTIKNARVIGEA